MSKPYPADVLDQIKAAIASWQAIDPTLKFGDLSLEMMQSVLEQGEALRNRIEALEIQLTDLRDRRRRDLSHRLEIYQPPARRHLWTLWG